MAVVYKNLVALNRNFLNSQSLFSFIVSLDSYNLRGEQGDSYNGEIEAKEIKRLVQSQTNRKEQSTNTSLPTKFASSNSGLRLHTQADHAPMTVILKLVLAKK